MPSIPPEILQFGVAGLMFIVWAYTAKQSNAAFVKVSEKSNDTVGKLAEQTSESYKEAIKDSRELNEKLMNLIRENAKDEQELKSHLIRVLTRMEEKLDQPVRCPAAIASRKGEADGQ